MLVNKNLLGLYNGVSQQPASIRLDSQCALQENAMSSLVDGLYKRPPTEIVATLDSVSREAVGFHSIIRDADEKYLVIFTNDATDPIEVFTLAGVKQTVQYGHLDDDNTFTEDTDVKAYLLCDDPQKDIKATTVADYTIITNMSKVCAMTETVQQPVVYEAIVYVKECIQQCVYRVTIDGTDCNSMSGASTSTETIKEALRGELITAFGTNFDITNVSANILHIKRKDSADFTFSVGDGWGNMALFGFKNAAQSYSDLPYTCTVNFTCEVYGDKANTYDNFYVKYINSGYTNGAWKECAKPGLCNAIDRTTMPHRLVRTGVGVFTFADIPYTDRIAGDEISASEPSFIGNTVNDVFFHKNRLGFVSGENVILSKSGEFWQFFPSSVMDVLDDDPIDVAVSSNQVTILHHALPYEKDLVVMSDLQQFVLQAGSSGGLTPTNVSCDVTTVFNTSPDCSPVASGANLYFVVPGVEYSTIREYFVNSDSLTNDAADVTAHCPNYIPKDVKKLVACSTLDMLFAWSSAEPKSIYVYKYYWRGEEKLQSSWSKWTFALDVLNMSVVGDALYLITSDTSGKYIEKINLAKTPTSTCAFTIHLDRQQVLTGVYDDQNNVTTFTVGAYYTGAAYQLIKVSTGARITAQSSIVNGVLSITGDYSDSDICIGIPYTMRYVFSEWFVKSKEGVANLAGVLKMRKVDIGYANTGYIKCSVTPLYRDALVHTFTPHIVGVAVVDAVSLSTGIKSFLLMCNASGSVVELSNETYLPSEIHAANFEGFYSTRSQAI